MPKTYVDSLKHIVDPLNPRDAFYGGLVNATKLLVKTESNPTTKIKYVDFNSLSARTSTRTTCTLWATASFSDSMRRVGTQRSLPSSITLQVSQQIDVCSVPHLRPRWSADYFVPTRGRTTHLHRDVGEHGIGSGLGFGVQGHEDSRSVAFSG